MSSPPISLLPPELLYVVFELAVEGLPASLRIRSAILRSFALVASNWREPAQALLEARVQIDSYQRARAFLDRPRRLDRPLVLHELVLYYDFAPQEDDLFPLTELMTKAVCEAAQSVQFLHLRSALLMDAFDANLLLLPAFRDLRHLKLDIPLEAPANATSIPLRLRKLSLSGMISQSPALFRAILPSSAHTLTSLHLFVVLSGSPLHERLLDALPSLTSTLRHFSIAGPWIALPASLLRFIASCTSLEALALSGVDLSQLRYLVPTLSSALSSLDFTVPSSPPSVDSDIPNIFDELLSARSLQRLRFLRATRRVENGGASGARTAWTRPREQPCACFYEVTTRASSPEAPDRLAPR
ncbi:hypothetical protein JCM10213_007048 [Rhodosporidiobolus nylandii]